MKELQKIKEALETLRYEALEASSKGKELINLESRWGEGGDGIIYAVQDVKHHTANALTALQVLQEKLEKPIFGISEKTIPMPNCNKDRYHYGYLACENKWFEKMESKELMEKVARAIHDNDNGLKADTIWDDLFLSTRKSYLEQAKATIKAIMEG